MIKFVERVDKDTLSSIIKTLCNKRNDVKLLCDEIVGTKEDNGRQFVFKNKDGRIIKSVVIDYVGITIHAITMYGQYNLTLKDLIDRYRDYRQVYVPYDDNYEFFFNEDKKDGNYVLKVFVDRGPFEKSDNFQLSNMQLFW